MNDDLRSLIASLEDQEERLLFTRSPSSAV
jgi:hypothetical protein